jgi:hypothetical protein
MNRDTALTEAEIVSYLIGDFVYVLNFDDRYEVWTGIELKEETHIIVGAYLGGIRID